MEAQVTVMDMNKCPLTPDEVPTNEKRMMTQGGEQMGLLNFLARVWASGHLGKHQ